MEKETISIWLPITSVFLSGIFGLFTALLTLTLANKKEKRRLSLELKRKEWQDLELLYANSIAVTDKIVQVTKAGNDYLTVIDQMTLVSAQIAIRGSESVNRQYQVVGDTLSVWTSAYQMGKPKKISGSHLAMISTENIKYQEMADEIFKDLVKDIQQYINTVKNELKAAKPKDQY